jgi:GNAT superfamily N-acetyltransferase
MIAEVRICKLVPSQHAMVRDHLLSLHRSDRYLRFLGYVNDDLVIAYSETMFGKGAIVLGAFTDGVLCAVGELRCPGTPWSSEGEVAITVEQPFQSQGIGTEMLRRLVEIARNRWITKLHCYCLLDNSRMQKMTRKLGGSLHTTNGTTEAYVTQAWPSYGSLLGEAFADGDALLSAWW